MHKDKPSRTAYKVALSMVTLAAKPGMDRILPSGIAEASEKLLVASGVAGTRTIRWSRSQRMVSVYEAFDWMLPPDFSGVNFVEIDHPATARLKAKGIETMGQRDNLFLIAEDLGKRKLVDVLTTKASWDQNAQTVIVAEGLVMYLDPEAVRDLFCQCAAIVRVGSRLALTYIPTGADGRPDAGPWTGLMLWLQKAAGEPWTWSIRLEELGLFLEESGWTYVPEQVETARKRGVEFFAVATK